MHSVPDRSTKQQKQKERQTKINKSYPGTYKKIIWDKRQNKII